MGLRSTPALREASMGSTFTCIVDFLQRHGCWGQKGLGRASSQGRYARKQ
jgi:hypothetical protein